MDPASLFCVLFYAVSFSCFFFFFFPSISRAIYSCPRLSSPRLLLFLPIPSPFPPGVWLLGHPLPSRPQGSAARGPDTGLGPPCTALASVTPPVSYEGPHSPQHRGRRQAALLPVGLLVAEQPRGRAEGLAAAAAAACACALRARGRDGRGRSCVLRALAGAAGGAGAVATEA